MPELQDVPTAAPIRPDSCWQSIGGGIKARRVGDVEARGDATARRRVATGW